VRERKQKEEAAHKKNYEYQNYGGKDHRALLAIAILTAICGESTGGISSTASGVEVRACRVFKYSMIWARFYRGLGRSLALRRNLLRLDAKPHADKDLLFPPL
jgi:hypothetical protein